MEDPKVAQKESEKMLAKSSTYNTEQMNIKRILLIIVIILTLISLALGAANIALFSVSIRTFPLTLLSWVSLTSTSVAEIYLWFAAGLYSFPAIIVAIIGLSIKDAKERLALAYIVLGPFVVLLALLQAAAGAMMFAGYYMRYSLTLTNPQFLYSLIDVAVAACGLLIAIWVLVVWIRLLMKRSKDKPFEEDEETDDETDDEDYYPNGPYAPRPYQPGPYPQRPYPPRGPRQQPRRRRNGKGKKGDPPTTLIQQIVNPGPQRNPGVYVPMPQQPRNNGLPRIIVVNPRMRMPPQGNPGYPQYPPPIRGPLPPLPPMIPYQPYGPVGNIPRNYQPRYY